MDSALIVWTDYMLYRVSLRHFDRARIEEILRHSTERYVDNTTGRLIVVGKHASQLVIIPYEMDDDTIRPVTVHTTTRGQINARLQSGRFSNE